MSPGGQRAAGAPVLLYLHSAVKLEKAVNYSEDRRSPAFLYRSDRTFHCMSARPFPFTMSERDLSLSASVHLLYSSSAFI
jgi:hypothetical protein